MKNIYICFIIHLYVSVIMSCVIFASDEKNIFDTFLQKIKDKSKTELGKKNSHLIEQKNASMKWLLEIFKEYRTFVQSTNIKKNNLLEVVNKFNTFNSQIQNRIKILQNKISNIFFQEERNKPNQKKRKNPDPDFMVLFYLEKISSRGIFFKLVKEDKLDLLKPIFDQLIDQKKIEKNNASIETLKSFIANAKIDGQASFIEENIKDNTAKNVMLNVVIASYFENNHSLNFSYNTLPKKVQLIRNRFRASNSQNFSVMTINREPNIYTIPGYGVISQTELLFFDLEGGGDIIQGFCVSLEKYKELLSKTNDESQLQSLKKKVQIIEEVRKSLPVKKTADSKTVEIQNELKDTASSVVKDENVTPSLVPSMPLPATFTEQDEHNKKECILNKDIDLPEDGEDDSIYYDPDPETEKEYMAKNPQCLFVGTQSEFKDTASSVVKDKKVMLSFVPPIPLSVISTEPDEHSKIEDILNKNIELLQNSTHISNRDILLNVLIAWYVEEQFKRNNDYNFSVDKLPERLMILKKQLTSKKMINEQESYDMKVFFGGNSLESVTRIYIIPEFGSIYQKDLPSLADGSDIITFGNTLKFKEIQKQKILEKGSDNNENKEVDVQSSIEEKSNQKSLWSYKSLLTSFGSLIHNSFTILLRKFWQFTHYIFTRFDEQ